MFRKVSLCLFGLVGLCAVFAVGITGCGEDKEDPLPEEPEEDVNKELIGTYVLVRLEIAGPEGKEVVPQPGFIATMEITSDRKLIENHFSKSEHETVNYEILRINEKSLSLELNQNDYTIISRPTYTWNGRILKTTVGFGEFTLTRVWRKLSADENLEEIIATHRRQWEMIEKKEKPDPPDPVRLISASPPSGTEHRKLLSIGLTFSEKPTDVTVNVGTHTVTGRIVRIRGPFDPGPLTLTVTWAGGSSTLTYTILEPDIDPPEVIGGTVNDGEIDVDPDVLNRGGIEVIFNEKVTGNIRLQTEDGDDAGWLGEVKGTKATLKTVPGKEIFNGTVYVIKGQVSDAAGNETEVNITFVTRAIE